MKTCIALDDKIRDKYSDLKKKSGIPIYKLLDIAVEPLEKYLIQIGLMAQEEEE